MNHSAVNQSAVNQSASEADTNLLLEGHLIDPAQSIDGQHRIWIQNDVVKAIDPADSDLPDDCQRESLGDHIIAPGLVDLCTEVRQPGCEEDETVESAALAAVAGGYTSLVVAANTEPCIDSPGSVEFVRQKAMKAGGPRIYPLACVSKDREGDQMAELGLLADAGAVGFSDAPRPIVNNALIKRALEYARMLERPLFDRPGVPELSIGGIMHEGCVSLVLGLRGLPTDAEDLAVARDVRLIEATEGRLHVGPISTMGAIDIVRRGKMRDVPVTVSVCPQNLILDDSKLRSFDARFKVHPPLRSPRHVEAAREALVDGTIDAVQSGHMPRAWEKKMNDLDNAAFGASMLESALIATAEVIVNQMNQPWSMVIDRMSTAPARIAGIAGGTLKPGSPADMVVIDPNQKTKVQPKSFRSRCRSTPLESLELQGRVTRTYVAGQLRFS